MTQPTRWLDDNNTPAELRELVLAGSRPPHFPKLALAAAIIPMAQKAALASTWSLPATAVVAVKATSVGLAIGLGSLAAVTLVSGPNESKLPNAPLSVAAPTSAAPSDWASQRSTHDPQPVEAAVPAAEPTAPVAASNANAVATSAIPKGIAAEAQILEHARALLNESPARALLLTQEHREQFRSGQMSAERELIAIDALLRLGRTREAEARAKPFLADGASQIFAQRVRNLLDRHGQP